MVKLYILHVKVKLGANKNNGNLRNILTEPNYSVILTYVTTFCFFC